MTVQLERTLTASEVTHAAALQMGFAWHCTKVEDGTQCDEAGNDRAEYEAHMRGHGAKACHSTKLIRLKRKAPAAARGKLPCDPVELISWTQEHAEPGTCMACGHSGRIHNSVWAHEDRQGCTECACTADYVAPNRTTAERRGQFWATGSRPGTVWVLPFEAAPWEDGRPVPVLLRPGTSGGFEYAGWNFDPRDAVKRAENVRARGVFAIRTGTGSLRGYYRASAYVVHADAECAAADGWRESDHQPYDTWAVVDRLTARSRGDGDHTLCPRCVLLEHAA